MVAENKEFSEPDEIGPGERTERTAALIGRLRDCLKEADALGQSQAGAYVQMGIDALERI